MPRAYSFFARCPLYFGCVSLTKYVIIHEGKNALSRPSGSTATTEPRVSSREKLPVESIMLNTQKTVSQAPLQYEAENLIYLYTQTQKRKKLNKIL